MQAVNDMVPMGRTADSRRSLPTVVQGCDVAMRKATRIGANSGKVMGLGTLATGRETKIQLFRWARGVGVQISPGLSNQASSVEDISTEHYKKNPESE